MIAEPICAILNASVTQGHVRNLWREANVIPIPKISPPKSVNSDLRPISLTATLSKILESFVGGWIFTSVSDKLNKNQFGALKRRSTSHALISVLYHWQNALDSGNSVRSLFVDYSKAYDRVDQNILLRKMITLNVPQFAIRWLFSFLKHRIQMVKLRSSNKFSDWTEVTAGMPQGTWLGPLTFVMYIDDLNPQCVVHAHVH